MRLFSDAEYDDLHVLIRAYCKENSISLKVFAANVARSALEQEHDEEPISDDEMGHAHNVVYRFFTKESNHGIADYSPFILEELLSQILARHTQAKDIYINVAKAMEQTSHYRQQSDVNAFFESRLDLHMVKTRKAIAAERARPARKALNSRHRTGVRIGRSSF